MIPIALIINGISAAAQVIGSFTGNAQAAKVNQAVQDAAKVIEGFTPLVQQFANGQEVTEDDMHAAVKRMGLTIDGLDAMIKQKGG